MLRPFIQWKWPNLSEDTIKTRPKHDLVCKNPHRIQVRKRPSQSFPEHISAITKRTIPLISCVYTGHKNRVGRSGKIRGAQKLITSFPEWQVLQLVLEYYALRTQGNALFRPLNCCTRLESQCAPQKAHRTPRTHSLLTDTCSYSSRAPLLPIASLSLRSRGGRKQC